MKTLIIPFAEFIEACPSTATYQAWIVGKLRGAGIPVLGVLVFRGLERGVLTSSFDLATGNLIFLWRP